MTALKDLDRCTCLPLDCDALLAVGWLGVDGDFRRGEVSSDFFEKLKALCVEPWQPVASAGFHQCGLCQFDGPRFSSNVFVPFNGSIYVAPVGIVHYVAAHRYLPPQVFIDGVLACPPMRSMAYHKALLANGGRGLVSGGPG
ncbi:hypothetical protein ACQ859_20515 [Roseateles chitinivorans]|uniref:DUF7919 family protein n=1 Tax=Roseateles chitinivorans TaxID=2917965 RepID=UPI003D679B31